MAKTSKKNSSSRESNDDDSNTTRTPVVVKVKRARKSVPRDSPAQRSSVFRGVTRHRWTGRYEAHLWDKNSWNEAQSKKGRQVYLGAYDDEEAAAHAYDLAALKYWGQETILNFPLATYEKEIKEMEGQSKEEYIGSLRRKSSGFSRGVSKYRGVARHHHNGRWEARIGRVFGNKYLYLGTYATQEEAATAYDMAAIEYRGLNAVTNFDLSRYVKWLRPDQNPDNLQPNPNAVSHDDNNELTPNNTTQEEGLSFTHQQQSSGSSETASPTPHDPAAGGGSATSSGLGLLLQSSEFKEMLERSSSSAATNSPATPPEPEPERPRRSFPDDIQTYFDGDDSSSFVEEHDIIFGDLSTFGSSSMFHCELDA